MKIKSKIGIAGVLGGVILSVSGLAGAASAQAASTTRVIPMCTHPCGSSPGFGWRYVDNYFRVQNCNRVGNRGINSHTWLQYQCKDGNAWTNYDLWVR